MANRKRTTQKLPKKDFSTTNKVSDPKAKSYKKITLYVIPVLIIILISVILINKNNNVTPNANQNNNVTPNANQNNNATPNTNQKAQNYNEAFNYQMAPPQKDDTVALMKTSLGDIKIKFFPTEAPKAVENFTKLAQEGYYNGLTFHRVMADFMIQGGDPAGNGTGGESIWKKPFADEFSDKVHNFRGALSMANSGANTNGSQFFIVQKKEMNDGSLDPTTMNNDLYKLYLANGGTQWLDGKHTVFGQVFQGMDIVDKIVLVKAQNTKPIEPVIMTKVEILKY